MVLSNMDIQELMKDPSPNKRAEVVDKVAILYHNNSTSDREKVVALEILNILARDIEVAVRRAVSLSIVDSLSIPHELVWKLANDVADVALPVLEHSAILSEDDLIRIVQSAEEMMKLTHIAKRETISTSLAEALLESGEDKTAYTLLDNKGAHLTEECILRQWDSLSANATLVEALVHRGGLPVKVAEKLFSVVSDELKRHLAQSYKLPITLVEDNIEDIREWTTLGMLMPDAAENDLAEEDLETFIHQLYTSNRLTYSMVIRALCTGDLSFFETAMAQLAGVPRGNARMLMFDNGQLGFRAFYEKANMPPAFYEAIQILLKLALEVTSYGRIKREDFRQRMVDHIYKHEYDKTIDNMQYLLTVIGGQFAANKPVH